MVMTSVSWTINSSNHYHVNLVENFNSRMRKFDDSMCCNLSLPFIITFPFFIQLQYVLLCRENIVRLSFIVYVQINSFLTLINGQFIWTITRFLWPGFVERYITNWGSWWNCREKKTPWRNLNGVVYIRLKYWNFLLFLVLEWYPKL